VTILVRTWSLSFLLRCSLHLCQTTKFLRLNALVPAPGPKTILVPREVVFGMDDVERKVSLSCWHRLVIAIIWAVEWVKKTRSKQHRNSSKERPVRRHIQACRQFCEHILKATILLATRFLFVFVVALFLLFFTLRRKRRRRVLQFFPGPRPGVAACVRLLGCLARRARLSTAALRRGRGRIEQGRKRSRKPSGGRVATPSLRPNRLPRRSRRTTPASKRYTPKQKRASVEPCQNSS